MLREYCEKVLAEKVDKSNNDVLYRLAVNAVEFLCALALREDRYEADDIKEDEKGKYVAFPLVLEDEETDITETHPMLVSLTPEGCKDKYKMTDNALKVIEYIDGLLLSEDIDFVGSGYYIDESPSLEEVEDGRSLYNLVYEVKLYKEEL